MIEGPTHSGHNFASFYVTNEKRVQAKSLGEVLGGSESTELPWVICENIAFEPATAELFGN